MLLESLIEEEFACSLIHVLYSTALLASTAVVQLGFAPDRSTAAAGPARAAGRRSRRSRLRDEDLGPPSLYSRASWGYRLLANW